MVDLEARPGPATAHGRSFVRSPPCLVGALGAIAGVFALRDETDSTFAGASLQWNETAITIAGDERPFSGQFQPAKVLAVSMGRAAWRAKVLAVSKLVRHRILCAQKFARISRSYRGARKSSPASPKRVKNAACWCAGRVSLGRTAASSHRERVYVRPQSLRWRLISRGERSHAIPLTVFQVMNSNR